MAWTKTVPFGGVGVGADYVKLDQGVNNTIALVEGAKGFERFAYETTRVTVTGNQDNYAPDGGAVAPVVAFGLVQWNGASSVTFRGLANGSTGGANGRVQRFQNITAAQPMLFKYEDTNSTAANRFLTPGNVSTVAVGPGGIVDAIYDTTSSRWRLFVTNPGAAIAVPFTAGDFTGNNSMTWTVDSGDVAAFWYQQFGNMLEVHLALASTTVGGTPSTELRVLLPNGWTFGTAMYEGGGLAFDNGGSAIGTVMQAAAAGTQLRFLKAAGGNWTASTNATSVYFRRGIPIA